MKPSWKTALSAAGIAVICGASVGWWVHSRESIKAEKQSEAVAEIRVHASQGNASAEFELGLLYYEGKVVAQNDTEAALWYRKAAEQGDAKAQSNLADLYFRGKGVPRDYAKAIYWSQEAADQGDVKGESGLGYLYFYGVGVLQDYTEAALWYRKAADAGEVAAQSALGYMYLHGQGVPQDRAEAIRWYRKAALQGDAGAERALRSLGGEPAIPARTKWFELTSAIIAFPVGLWFSLEFLMPGRQLRDWRQLFITLMGLSFLLGAGLSTYALEKYDLCYSPHRGAFQCARLVSNAIGVVILITVVLPAKNRRPTAKVLRSTEQRH